MFCNSLSTPNIEWFDGDEFNGCIGIKSFGFECNLLEIEVKSGNRFEITFKIDEDIFEKINLFLLNCI